MYGRMKSDLQQELSAIRDAGLYKQERKILSPQSAEIRVEFPEGNPPREVINFCANNYLGLSSHPKVIAAARKALDTHGYGLSSVRFICGTQDIHKALERKISEFLGTEDTILYSSCFDANGGLFEPLLSAEDAIITDQLNHASIIDGIRLCKARRLIYANNNMADLEAKLKESMFVNDATSPNPLRGKEGGKSAAMSQEGTDAADGGHAPPPLIRGASERQLAGGSRRPSRYRMIATDGAFSMDGTIAKIDQICDLADKYDALVMVDDSHATGFLGRTGRGSAEHCGALGRVDVYTSTLGKALGGASGGFTSGRKEIIDLLRQRSRPYLFSNSVSPVVAAASIAVIDLLSESTALRDKLEANTRRFREGMTAAGFDIKSDPRPERAADFSPRGPSGSEPSGAGSDPRPSLSQPSGAGSEPRPSGSGCVDPPSPGVSTHAAARDFPGHPIVPIMLYDAKLAQQMARDLYEEGIYVIGFSYPVVPKDHARIRVQLSAAHEFEHIDKAIEAFKKIGRKHGVLKT